MSTPGKFSDYLPAPDASLDVLVAGGGPAGLGAALTAAHKGAKTLLVEALPFFGGTGTRALWMPMNRMLQDGGSRGGVHELYAEKLRSLGQRAFTRGRENDFDGDSLDVHPDYAKLAAFELLEEAGCSYLLHSPVVDTLMDGNDVTGVAVSTKSGPVNYHARIIIDATGDGDVAFHAGAEMVKGNEEEEGHFLPVTLTFALANVDVDRAFAARYGDPSGRQWSQEVIDPVVEKAREEGYFVSSFYSFDRTTLPGVISVNNANWVDLGNLDATRNDHLTLAERAGLQVALDFVEICHRYELPGLEDCYLLRTGSSVAVRETRRILGEYVLTVDDVRAGREFDDVVARKYGPIDSIHAQEPTIYSVSYPYRCMVPRTVESLLAAGRCGSATHLAHAAGKSMGNMMALGQAAGAAAALCVQHRVSPRRLDVSALQDELRSMGVKLDAAAGPPEA
jgi:hypothetical protein